MLRRIMVPLDGSELAERALPCAVPLDGSARAEKALRVVQELAGSVVREVTLLRVITAPDEGPAAERYLEEVTQRLHGEGLVCGRHVAQGDPAQVIGDVAGRDRLV